MQWTTDLSAAPPRLALVTGEGEMVDPETGEALDRTTKCVLCDDVHGIPERYAPRAKFNLTMRRDGQLVEAVSRVIVAKHLDTAYPGAVGYADVCDAEDAMRAAGLSRGGSPASRALDWAMRQRPGIRQWRVRSCFTAAFQAALYGGVQLGGTNKPALHLPPPRAGFGWYHADIVSSYPALAVGQLPTVPSVYATRGLHPRAAFYHVDPTPQNGAYLWRRDAYGQPYFDEHIAGWYVADEISFLLGVGAIDHAQVKISHSLVFSTHDHYLEPVVAHLWHHKEAETRPARKMPMKIALNGLIGKFAARLSPWRAKRPDDQPRAANWVTIGASTLVWDAKLAALYPATANVAWTALICARARVKLWEKISEIEYAGGRVVWAHTDCVIAEVPDSYLPFREGTALGQWRTLLRTFARGSDERQFAAA